MIVNYANMFNLGNLSGSIYLNSILVGSLRYSSNLLFGLLDYKFVCFGRKMAHVASQLLIIGSLILSASILYTAFDCCTAEDFAFFRANISVPVLIPETKNKPLEDHIVKKPKKNAGQV
ncbi:hypothetical protein ANCCAN_19449 [Ancylostoma caninum]|uniref:Uncharacterized protein n=1 Tax=Ancylostoma caninum TaxID=29170 RepID=A0A368FT88_ANCCA|nr:hypothetical protein ANCCAN_19449 [Ancylostoma caninum]